MTGEMRIYGSGQWRGASPDHDYQQAVDQIEAAAERTEAQRSALIRELSVNHAAEYAAWRDRYVESGELADLDEMLSHVAAG